MSAPFITINKKLFDSLDEAFQWTKEQQLKSIRSRKTQAQDLTALVLQEKALDELTLQKWIISILAEYVTRVLSAKTAAEIRSYTEEHGEEETDR